MVGSKFEFGQPCFNISCEQTDFCFCSMLWMITYPESNFIVLFMRNITEDSHAHASNLQQHDQCNIHVWKDCRDVVHYCRNINSRCRNGLKFLSTTQSLQVMAEPVQTTWYIVHTKLFESTLARENAMKHCIQEKDSLHYIGSFFGLKLTRIIA